MENVEWCLLQAFLSGLGLGREIGQRQEPFKVWRYGQYSDNDQVFVEGWRQRQAFMQTYLITFNKYQQPQWQKRSMSDSEYSNKTSRSQRSEIKNSTFDLMLGAIKAQHPIRLFNRQFESRQFTLQFQVRFDRSSDNWRFDSPNKSWRSMVSKDLINGFKHMQHPSWSGEISRSDKMLKRD